jgi:hypothetical protein
MATIDTVDYTVGDELESLQLWWFANSALVDLSVAHTYSSKLYKASDATHTNVFSALKTTGFTGAAGSGTKPSGTPNLVVTWATTGELNSTMTDGLYIFQIVATRTSDGKQRTGEVRFQMVNR